MTVLDTFQRSRVQCDACRKAWVFVDGYVAAGLSNAGWDTDDGRHVCPPCVTAVKAGRASRSVGPKDSITSYVDGRKP